MSDIGEFDPVQDATTTSQMHQFLPPYQMGLSRVEQFQKFTSIGKQFVGDTNLNIKPFAPKAQDAERHRQHINSELEKLVSDSDAHGEDCNDLQVLDVYRRAFDNIMLDFKTYAPLLADIKHEYDKHIDRNTQKVNHIAFLKSKIQTLTAQNSNRLMLVFEQAKSGYYAEQLVRLKDEYLKYRLNNLVPLPI